MAFDPEIHIKQNHKFYAQVLKQYNFFRDMYIGDEEIKKKPYLAAYSKREKVEDYDDRAERSMYSGFPKAIIGIYRDGIYTAGNINRPEGGSSIKKKLESFHEDVDRRGTSMSEFMKKDVFNWSNALGDYYVGVDRLNSEVGFVPGSQFDADSDTAYAYTIDPELVTNWHVDRFGNYFWLVYKDSADNYDIDRKTYKEDIVYKVWTTEHWAIYDIKGALIPISGVTKIYPHAFKIVPIMRATITPNTRTAKQTGISSIADIKDQVLTIFNLDSQTEQIIINTAFPIMEASTAAIAAMKKSGKGVKNVLPREDKEQPEARYIVVDLKSLDEIAKRRDAIIAEIYELVKIRYKGRQTVVESGKAKVVDSRDESNALSSLARAMEKIERKLHSIFYAVNGYTPSSDDLAISYPIDFDVETGQEKIDKLIKIFDLDIGSLTGNRKLAFQVYEKLLGNSGPKLLQEIKDQINTVDPSKDVEDNLVLESNGYISIKTVVDTYNQDATDEEKKELVDKKEASKKVSAGLPDVNFGDEG